MSGLLQNAVERVVDAAPFVQKQREDFGAAGREAIKTFVALIFFAPLAEQQALRFEAAQQRIERAFVDNQAVVLERLAQCVAVLLGPQLRQNGDDQAAATKFEAQGFVKFSVYGGEALVDKGLEAG